MLKLIIVALIGVFILKNISNIITLILQAIVVWIGFMLHPFIGIFLLIAYAADWLGFGKENDNNKRQKKYNNTYFNDDGDYKERKKEEKTYRHNNQQERPKQQQKPKGYFTGCTTKEQLKKRHRELCKIYHPDKGGDIEVFKKMQAEYERLILKFK